MKLFRRHLNCILFAALLLVLNGCCPAPLILSNEGFQANIEASNPPSVLTRGERRQINVKIRNASELNWLKPGVEHNWLTRGETGGKFRINLGNHWLDETGKSFINDDGRELLPDVVKPGETVSASLYINAPQSSDTYILELDLVQENVTWFARKGSKTARYNIKVE